MEGSQSNIQSQQNMSLFGLYESKEIFSADTAHRFLPCHFLSLLNVAGADLTPVFGGQVQRPS